MKETTKTVALTYPITVSGATISAVTIRRPKAKDIRAFEAARASGGSETDLSLQMIQTLSGLDAEVVDELDVDDFTAIGEAVAGFFPQEPAQTAGGA